MKKNFINAIFLFVLLSASTIANAQKDYVVSLTGDTLIGNIKAPLFGPLKFIANEAKQKVDISIKEHLSYYTSKDSTAYIAVSIPLKNSPVFLQRLENGKVQLVVYYITHVGANGIGTSQTFWYAIKDNGKPLDVKASSLLGSRKERENNFYGIIGDYPELLEDFKNEKSYSFEMIRSYIKKYNYYYKYLKK